MTDVEFAELRYPGRPAALGVVSGGLMFWNLHRTKWAGLAETAE